jgi:hypothetical protein
MRRALPVLIVLIGGAHAQIGWENEFGKIECGYLNADGSFEQVHGREDMMMDAEKYKVWRWTLDDTESTFVDNIKKCRDQLEGDQTATEQTGTTYAGILEFKTSAITGTVDGDDGEIEAVRMQPLDLSFETLHQVRAEMQDIFIELENYRKNHAECREGAEATACWTSKTPLGKLVSRGNSATTTFDTVGITQTEGKWVCSIPCKRNLFNEHASLQVTSNVGWDMLLNTDTELQGKFSTEYAMTMTKMVHEKAYDVEAFVKACEDQGLIPGTTSKTEFQKHVGVWWSHFSFEQRANPDKNRTPYYKDATPVKALAGNKIFGDAENRKSIRKICRQQGMDGTLQACEHFSGQGGKPEASGYAVCEERIAKTPCALLANPQSQESNVAKCWVQLHNKNVNFGNPLDVSRASLHLDKDMPAYMTPCSAETADTLNCLPSTPVLTEDGTVEAGPRPKTYANTRTIAVHSAASRTNLHTIVRTKEAAKGLADQTEQSKQRIRRRREKDAQDSLCTACCTCIAQKAPAANLWKFNSCSKMKSGAPTCHLLHPNCGPPPCTAACS